MSWPAWQYPHCGTSSSIQARCSGCDPSGGRLSMVETARVPIDEIGVMHERVGWPSTSTVQAPHWAMPQPNLVPFNPMASRSTQSRGMRSGTSTVRRSPLTTTVYFMCEASGSRLSGSTRQYRVPTAGFAALTSRIPSESV